MWWEHWSQNPEIEQATTNSRSFMAPANLLHPRRFRFESAGVALPREIPAMVDTAETVIMRALYDTLNTKFSTGLAPPNLYRLGGASESDREGGRLTGRRIQLAVNADRGVPGLRKRGACTSQSSTMWCTTG